jgi:hypothetical protein
MDDTNLVYSLCPDYIYITEMDNCKYIKAEKVKKRIMQEIDNCKSIATAERYKNILKDLDIG